MPSFILKLEDTDRRISFTSGQSLREILDSTEFRVRSGCRGTGACGLCRVQILSKAPDGPTPSELICLSDEKIALGVRLACQVRPRDGMEVLIINRAPQSIWKAIPPTVLRRSRSDRVIGCPARDLPEGIRHAYGMAADIGTTHISLSLYELSAGTWVTGRQGLNPQIQFGADVMTRLTAACESKELAQTLRRQAIDALGEAIIDAATREGIATEEVVRLVIVGNTAMLSLLSGHNYHLLLQPDNWVRSIDCLPAHYNELSLDWGVHPEASIEILPPLAGFVGSDLLAGVLASEIVGDKPGSLLIDFGTNSEIALWDGEVLWVTSAAGGPAFEGCGLSCGVPAEPGAIYQIRNPVLDDNRKSINCNLDSIGCCAGFAERVMTLNVLGLDLLFKTIGDADPIGICGSGIVDLIACLVRSGKISDIGRFASDVPQGGFVLLDGDRKLAFTKKDVDIFQQAKAAINAAIRVLLSMAALDYRDLRRICIGGAFGRYLNKENARIIGLLPNISEDAVEICGNIALAGCEDLLLSSSSTELLRKVTSRARIVNLSHSPYFADCFLEGLYLAPSK